MPTEELIETEPIAAEITEQQEPETVVEPVAEDQPEPPAVKGDERTLPQYIRDQKATNPEAYRANKDLWFSKRAYDDKLPGGVKELEAVQSWLSENGGIEGATQRLTELAGQVDEWQGVQREIAEGNPAVIQRLPEESVAKLGPVMNSRWAQTDPEGWSRSMSSVMASTLNQPGGVSEVLQRMQYALQYGGANALEEVGTTVAGLVKWAASFSQAANAPVQQRQAQGGGLDPVKQGMQEVEQQKTQLYDQELKRDTDSWRDSEINKHIAEATKGKKVDDADRSATMQDIVMRVRQAMAQDKPFIEQLNRLRQARDMDGAVKLVKSREAQKIKDIAPAMAQRQLGGSPAAPKAAVTPRAAAIRPSSNERVDPFEAILRRSQER